MSLRPITNTTYRPESHDLACPTRYEVEIQSGLRQYQELSWLRTRSGYCHFDWYEGKKLILFLSLTTRFVHDKEVGWVVHSGKRKGPPVAHTVLRFSLELVHPVLVRFICIYLYMRVRTYTKIFVVSLYISCCGPSIKCSNEPNPPPPTPGCTSLLVFSHPSIRLSVFFCFVTFHHTHRTSVFTYIICVCVHTRVCACGIIPYYEV